MTEQASATEIEHRMANVLKGLVARLQDEGIQVNRT
jgi:hypothetical protein